jgi:hypothetical protein
LPDAGLDVSPLKKPGKRIGNIKFAAPRQTSQVSDRAPLYGKEGYVTVQSHPDPGNSSLCVQLELAPMEFVILQ